MIEISEDDKKALFDEHKGAMQFRHICMRTPPCAWLEYNPKKKEDNFTLTFWKRETKGVLEPKVITIMYPVNFCPYCGIEFTRDVFLERKEGERKFEPCIRCGEKTTKIFCETC
jgi:hypothetical protein